MTKISKFWKSWKNKSPREIRAINSIQKAISFLFKNIPRDKIIAVYIKGSFVTREMNKKSDVDIVPILKDNNTIRSLKIVRDENKEMLKPSELLPISLTELKHNENSKHHGKLKGKPDTFLRDLEHYKLIYGKGLNKLDYPMRDFNKMFHHAILGIKSKTLPMHKKGKFGFSQLIKQVFWISYSEQVMQGKSPPRTWQGLNKFIKDKNHIIHKTYYFRMHPTKDKRKRKAFINRLKVYLNHLGRKIKDVYPN